MKITFTTKEMIAAIARRITIVTALHGGMQIQDAEFSGSILEGAVKGFGLKNEPQSVSEKLMDTIDHALNEIISSPDYELPDVCKEELRKEAFSIQKALQYIQSDSPVELFTQTISDICAQSSECDIKTLPIDNMVAKMISHVEKAIQDNHELTGLSTLINSKEILSKLDIILSILTSKMGSYYAKEEYTDMENYKKARQTAESFAKAFNEPLFAEHQFEKSIRLRDVYVDSIFVPSSGYEYSDFDELYKSCKEMSCILIEGDPGIGKSSLAMKVAMSYLSNDIFQDMNVFFIRGKEIRQSDGNPIEDILKITRIKTTDALDNSIIFLDAYDEISYVSESVERNQEYMNRLVRAFDNAVLIITSRPKYIKHFVGETVKMRGFYPEQRRVFLEKYNSKRDEADKLPRNFIEELTQEDIQYQDQINEILSIPMLLYIISVRMVNINEIEDRFNLYEVIFGPDGKGALNTRGKERKSVSQSIWSETYELALQIARTIYFKNDLYISENDIISHIYNMKISASSKEVLKNRFGVEIFLKGAQNNIFTFVHTSIYEYFAAKWICKKLREIIIGHLHESWSLEQVIVELNKTFNTMHFDRNVFYYVMHNINKEYFTSIFRDENLLYNTSNLLNNLLCSNICEGNDSSGIPYFIQMKNMLLWTFNSFNIIFGMFEIDKNAHWVKLNYDAIRFLLKLKNAEDVLFLSHLDLSNIFLEKTDFGETHFIDNDLTSADFTSSSCTSISSSGQRFCKMRFKFADFWKNDLRGYVFDGSDFRFSDFRETILNGASFRGADLRCVSFDNAEIYGVDFTDSHIIIEDFENAHYDEDAFINAIIHDVSEDPNYPLLFFDEELQDN
ncbi:pentapeptide repeat-containing protein [Sedimentibacter hydroxybenzoicus DSM 7310]|uniref:Pentapeptide repeat-containing protein n=1 Tax=Sedimentibacter hydroxybenzoicus DSM 7310 TaxID=1123245 RepID=A0A974BK65_SEDHY|nr:pentapeptide repeat-containing protein [Sedimentibacter hydroxybenzoicus]NYB74533.1 pentapeptide repeat-containing protein [Sedimentibacter hydroxybenzoicus DSM 7310]